MEAWFASKGRDFAWRHWRDPYRILVVEILLQRTQADSVGRYIEGFLDRFSSPDALRAVTVGDLEEALRPLGLQRRRAAALKTLASQAIQPPWEGLAAVGQYVARAAAVNVDNERRAMVDSNFVRLLRRVFGGEWMSDYRYDVRLQSLAQAVVDGSTDPRAVNWAVLDLGAAVCLPRHPQCGACPIRDYCLTGSPR